VYLTHVFYLTRLGRARSVRTQGAISRGRSSFVNSNPTSLDTSRRLLNC
jgi:hypothetical protein